MIVLSPQKVSERITLLGRPETCLYLLDGGGESAIIGGGMAYAAPDVLAQLRSFGADVRLIKRIFILHTHFDHMGMVPLLRRILPHAKVCATRQGARMLERPEVIETVLAYNRALVAMNHPDAREEDFGLPFDVVTVDEVLEDGMCVRVGDMALDVMEVPGHSSCSMALYCREEKALFPSDASGIMYDGMIFTAANSNFDLYQKSLERMSRLDIEFHCAEHYGALTHEDARGFLARTMESAARMRQLIEDSLMRTRDMNETARDLTEMFFAKASNNFLPRQVVETVFGQMTRFIASQMRGNPLR